MIRNARTAIKFFVYGVIVGLMFAPQSGAETRARLLGWIGDTMQETVSSVAGSNQQSGNQQSGSE